MLRDLHEVLRTYPAALLPTLPEGPLADIPAFLARRPTSPASQSVVSDADAGTLAEAFSRLTGDLAAATADAPAQALHGDAGALNLMATGGRRVWHDFEEAWSGPVAWDLAATTASPRFDRARILAAYAGHADDAEPAGLLACEQLRRLHLTIWYALYAERLPDCRQRSCWRAGGRPSRPPLPASPGSCWWRWRRPCPRRRRCPRGRTRPVGPA